MTARTERWLRYWDRHARSYDREMRFFERALFKDSRLWICSQARGDTLEVGIGTGRNIAFYPKDVGLIGLDVSEGMLNHARRRANELGRAVELHMGDAAHLPFGDASFDTVVSTLSLCAIPDDRGAVREMMRVLRPGGRLLLADHIASSSVVVHLLQRAFEVFTVPLQGEHFLRRPSATAQREGFEIETRERFSLGVIERIVARKPVPADA